MKHQTFMIPVFVLVAACMTFVAPLRAADTTPIAAAGADAGTAPGAHAPEAVTGRLVETVHFETTDFDTLMVANDRERPQMTHNGHIYFLWIDKTLRPHVSKICETTGKTETAFLTGPDYKVLRDPHNRFSLGVDADGYIHIFGDMHNHPYHSQNTLPERYHRSNMLYWISDKPEDVSSFSFAGHDPDRTVPGYGWSYGYFVRDNQDVLYLASRVGGYQTRAYGLYRYDHVARKWTALGGLDKALNVPGNMTKIGDMEIPPVFLFRVPYGHGGHPYYQLYQPHPMFDYNNRLHISVRCKAVDDKDAGGDTHMVYAYSDDGGDTFRRVDGSLIESLPMRTEPAENRPSMVVENYMPHIPGRVGPSAPFYDKAGNVAVSTELHYWYYERETQKWVGPIDAPVKKGFWSASVYLDPKGIVTWIYGGDVWRTKNLLPNQPGWRYNVPGGLFAVDGSLVRTRGIFRGVSIDNGKMMIKTVEFIDP